MVTTFYAAISAILIMWLALQVVKARRKNRIKYADGDVEELQIVRTAHSNAIDNIPIAIILLFLLEYNGCPIWLVHIFGLSLLTGRFTHSYGILKERMGGRVQGMRITVFTIISLAVFNLAFLPYDKFFMLN